MNNSEYNIMIPCTQENFAQFMSGLLGKNQTTEKNINGSYTIRQKDIQDIYSLLDQRIKQQNSGSLLQFNITVFFDDDSSSLFTDIDSFLIFRDINLRESIRIVMQWVYLIRFHDKELPEKQMISVTCQTKSSFKKIEKVDRYLVDKYAYGNILISIEHTARTWANDIEMLLVKYFENIQNKSSRIKKFIYNNSGKIGLLFCIVIFAIFLIGGYITGNEISNKISENTLSIITNTHEIEKKIDVIISLYSQDLWSKYYFFFAWYLIISIIISIVFSVIFSDILSNPNKLIIVITETDEKRYEEEEKNKKKENRNLLFSFISGIISGVVGNALFYIIANIFLIK